MSSRRSLTILRVITSFNSALHIQLDSRKASNSCMSLAGLLVLSGCAGLQMKLGMRVDLQKIPVASVQASQAKWAWHRSGRQISARSHSDPARRQEAHD
jgi:hypothetical protein